MVGAVLVALLVLFATPDRDGVTKAAASTSPGSLPVAVLSVKPWAGAMAVPRSYFGLSTEYWALPIYERRLALFDRVLALLHVQGNGPLVLRIGGDSADHAHWDPQSRSLPPWVFKVTPAWLSRTAELVRRTGLRVILDLNLITGSPLMGFDLASAAEQKLPRGSIVGFEIGNEDDIYSRSYWRATIPRTSLDRSVLPARFSPATYISDFRSYAQVLSRAAPHVPLLGPALANPAAHASWISRLLTGPHPGLSVVSAHRYPFSACARRGSAGYPTISRLLSDRSSAGMARSIGRVARIAHRAGLPFRLDELNSITCGGLAGVSDSFAAALWAPDALFELLRAGVQGVNVHIRATTVNAPFALGRSGLEPRPLLYGLILFTEALGPHAQLLPVRLHTKRSLRLSAWAVRVLGNTLHVLLIDKSDRSIRVSIHLPASGPATVERLLAPSAAARSGVSLGDRDLGPDGRWRGSPSADRIIPGPRGYTLTIRGPSAALVTVTSQASRT